MTYRELTAGDDVWHLTFGNGFIVDAKQDSRGVYNRFIVVFEAGGQRELSGASLFPGHSERFA